MFHVPTLVKFIVHIVIYKYLTTNHGAVIVKQFMDKESIIELCQLVYLPDLPPYDFLFYTELKT